MNTKQSRYKKNQFTKLLVTLLFSITSIATTITTKPNTIYWDWKTINPLKVSFPESFLWGTTTNAYEVEGNCSNNTWYLWETEIKNGEPFATKRSADACDHWNRYKEDIQKMKKMGLKAYCFSLSWEKIEPCEGYFDDNALQHYVDVCDELVRNDIKPVIIIKDYRDPIWFAHKGGFEKEENITYFVRFFKKVFEQLHDKVGQWTTFWNPEVYAINGYLMGSLPPGKKNMHTAITVLENIVEAHVQVYKTGKKIDETAQIGITKHIYPVEPWNNANPLDRFACWITNKLMNELLYDFFTTGTFSIKIPLPGRYYAMVTHKKNVYAPKSLDFIGISYHSHGYMNNFKAMRNPDEIETDIARFSIHPEGLYEAIKQVAEQIAQPIGEKKGIDSIPIYIMQNGIATTDASTQDLFLKRHLYALAKAIDDNFNVRGYFYWTFMDCYSWGAYNIKMGLLTQEREDKEGAQYFIDVINNRCE